MLVVLYLFGVGGFTGILRRIAKEFTFDEAVTAAIFWPVAALFVAASPVLPASTSQERLMIRHGTSRRTHAMRGGGYEKNGVRISYGEWERFGPSSNLTRNFSALRGPDLGIIRRKR